MAGWLLCHKRAGGRPRKCLAMIPKAASYRAKHPSGRLLALNRAPRLPVSAHSDSCRRPPPHLLGQTRGLAHRPSRLRLPRRRPGSSVDSPLLSFCLVRPFLRHPSIGSYASPLLHTGSRKRFHQRPGMYVISRQVKRLNTRYSIRRAPRGTSGTPRDPPQGLDSESPMAAGRSPARTYRSRCCGF